jgi:macrolide transport system ATP-binding/permease protein
VRGVSAPSILMSSIVAPTPSPSNPLAGVPTSNSVYSQTTTVTSPFGSPPKIIGVVNVIYVQARSAEEVNTLMAEVQQVLHEGHRIQPGQDDDFTIRSLNEIAKASESASRVMALLLAAVASISLLVGVIGIMNIMLVSVTERTREI